MKVTLSSLERAHRKQIRRTYAPPSRRELLRTGGLTVVTTPWLLATFGVIPMIGQGLVLTLLALAFCYLVARRSPLVALTMIGSFAAVIIALLLSIQGIKYRLEVVLFFLVSTGIPVTCGLILLLFALIWLQFNPELLSEASGNSSNRRAA